jgi:hypothetical protein
MQINIDVILLEIENYLPAWKHKEQISLQTVKGETDPFVGTGRLKDLKNSERDFCVPIFDEMKYTNSVIQDLKMYRTRVMLLPPKSCYTYHKDPSKRMHIPLITNENCFFVLDDEVVRLLADGNHYLIDTTKKHTFVNASMEERIHIVGCVDD